LNRLFLFVIDRTELLSAGEQVKISSKFICLYSAGLDKYAETCIQQVKFERILKTNRNET